MKAPVAVARVEARKTAHQLGVEPAEVDFLTALDPDVVRDLRERIDAARFARHDDRFRRLAALSSLPPPRIVARIAQGALGPMLAARVAAVMPADTAVALAGRMEPEFLTALSVHLDPRRADAIVRGLPDGLVVDVGRRLLEQGEHLTLGRLVSVVDTDAALEVVAEADGEALLDIAVLTEDPEALDRVLERLDDDRLAAMVRAGDADRLAALHALVSSDTRARLERLND
jgi:hypothetical protein